MAWVELCPAMKPTASSPDAAGVTDPDEADRAGGRGSGRGVETGLVVATPLNSCSWRATVDAPVVTVTLCTEAALGAYQSSPAELAPETKLSMTLVQVFLPSETAVMGWLPPVNVPADRTSRSPGVLAAGRVTVVVDEPAAWTRAGPEGPVGVVAVAGGELWADTLPAPSRASTVYE